MHSNERRARVQRIASRTTAATRANSERRFSYSAPMGSRKSTMTFIEASARDVPPLAFTPQSMDFDRPPVDPVAECERWFAEAWQLPTPNPNAMTLATSTARGVPSARTVLLKAFDAYGAVFFTNRESRKGEELRANPVAEVLFHWDQLGRQLRVAGAVSELDDDDSDAYFATRPRDSQIGAWASDQSRPLADRETLLGRVTESMATYDGINIPRPPHWGGYRISLDTIEFWQAHPFRIHDRVVYRRSGTNWLTTRLFP